MTRSPPSSSRSARRRSRAWRSHTSRTRCSGTPRRSAAATMPPPTIDELTLGDEPERWHALGFTVSGESCRLGDVRLRLAGAQAGRGIVGWSLREVAGTELDGLPTSRSERTADLTEPAAAHPNGVLAIDHVVAVSPSLDRSVLALQAAGLDLRRRREQ